jgi:hypothetical protein
MDTPIIEEEFSGPEWAILVIGLAFVQLFTWTVQLTVWLAGSSVWSKTDRAVGRAIVRGWTRFSNSVDRAIHSRTATILLGAMLVIIAISTAMLVATELNPALRVLLTPR